jgi:hypothetical protein
LLEASEAAFDLSGRSELVPDVDGQFGDLVLHVVKDQGPHRYQHATMFQDSLDLGYQRVLDLERLHRTEGRLGQQLARRGHRIERVGLICAAGPSLRRRALRRNLAAIEPGRTESDRGVSAPAGGPLNPDLSNTLRVEKLDGLEISGRGGAERVVADLDPVAVHHGDRDAVLLWVDARHR